MMAQMGYVPGKGLRKDLQGIVQPVELEGNPDKLGLGFLQGH